jgi:hypothetical protein
LIHFTPTVKGLDVQVSCFAVSGIGVTNEVGIRHGGDVPIAVEFDD